MRARPYQLLLLLTLPACTWFTSDDSVLITSDPLGAHVAIDGVDTGFSTPCKLAIAGSFGGDHQVEVSKQGYRTVVRTLYQQTEGYTSKWIDGATEPSEPPLPFFWTAGDLVFPFGVRGAIVPHELHVKLYRADAPLLGFELPAASASTP